MKEANAKHAELLQVATKDVNDTALKADVIIAELFAKAKIIETSDVIFSKALHRFRLGNPPGKKKVTMGDEVNWDALLADVPNGEDLHLVSGDSDYAAVMDADKINPFLYDEWQDKKSSSIIFYKSLPDFFTSNYPDIKLASDIKKNTLIEQLSKSGSFATTHLVIDKLASMDDFSINQVEQLIQIADMNRQVGWIIKDDDVLSFYSKLKEKYASAISAESLGTLDQLLPEVQQADDDDITF